MPAAACERARQKLRSLGQLGKVAKVVEAEVASSSNTSPNHELYIDHLDGCFFPRGDLLKLFSRSRVTKVLNCDCPRCENHRRIIEYSIGRHNVRNLLDFIIPDEGDAWDLRASALALFACMVYIEHPQFIVFFCTKDFNDANSLESWTKQGRENSPVNSIKRPLLGLGKAAIRHRINPGFGDADLDAFIDSIKVHMYRFSVPFFDTPRYLDLPLEAILPFYREQEYFGTGSFGDVISFKIYDGYNRLKLFKHVEIFARKQMRENQLPPFFHEISNLQLVAPLEDDHIVKFVKAYRHGDDLNIIMPFAKTTLNHCFRQKAVHYDQCLIPAIIQECPIWLQMLGLAEALNRIHTELETPRAQLFCYHFDLKPDNILAHGDEPGSFVFMIADLGLAHVQARQRGSFVRSKIGDPAYAPPPDLDFPNDKVDRKYDVWSFGCILLEATAFTVGSYETVTELDDARNRDTFWEEGPYNFSRRASPGVLKKNVNDFMDRLLEFVPTPEKTFIRQILGLVRSMLTPSSISRINSDEVAKEMSKILNVPDNQDAGRLNFDLQRENEVEYDKLRKVKKLQIRPSSGDASDPRQPSSIVLQIFKNQQTEQLRFVTVPRNQSNPGPMSPLGEKHIKRNLAIVPHYAMLSHHRERVRETGIRFLDITPIQNNEPAVPIFDVDFDGALPDLRRMQQVLLEWRIRYSIDKVGFHFNPPVSTRKAMATGIKTLVGLGKQASGSASTSTVQLWQDETSKANSADFIVAVYFQGTIVLIPVDKDWRLEDLLPEQENNED